MPTLSFDSAHAMAMFGGLALRVAAALALTLLAARALRHQSAARRHVVLVVGTLGALVLPLLHLASPRWEIAVLPADPQAPITPRAAVALTENRAPVTTPVVLPTMEARTPSPDPTPVPVPSAISFGVALAAAWLAGVVTLLGQLALGIVRRTRLAARATDLLPAPWERARTRLTSRHGFPARVRLLASDRLTMPITWGVLRPVILVPGETTWTESEHDAALLHELAHIRRRDALCLHLFSVLRAIHWYNPLAWWLKSAEQLAREEACDDLVLTAGVRPSAYAEQLLGLARHPRLLKGPAAALAMARPSSVVHRIKSILRGDQRRDVPGRRWGVALGAAAIMLAAGLATATPVPGAAVSPRGALGPVTTPLAPPSLTVALPPHSPDSPTAAETEVDSAVGAGAYDTVASSPVKGVEEAAISALSTLNRVEVRSTSANASSIAHPSLLAAATKPAPTQERCTARNGSRTSSSLHSDSDGRQRTVLWASNGCRIELATRGDFTLTATLDDVRTLSNGGSFRLKEDDGKVEHDVRITNGRDGSLDHAYRVDGENRPWDSEGKAWFASAVLRLDRRTAFAIDARFPALLQRGVEGVLSEIELLEGDYARRVYFSRLATTAQLSSTQLVRVITTAGNSIESDYEMAELLITAGRQKAFDDPAQLALARAAGRIKSDYEKRRTFAVLLSRQGLSAATVGEILAGTRGMESDYELAELLIAVARQYAIDPSTRSFYLDALGTIESDYEYRRVLETVVASGPLPAEFTANILQHAGSHMSGYELAELLISLGKSVAANPTLGEPYLAAARRVGSGYEQARVLKGLVQQRPDTSVVLNILRSARSIASEYERAELLLSVAAAYRLEGAMREAYLDAADLIGSDHERGRVLSAAGRRSAR